MSEMKGNKENAFNGQQKDSAQKETLAVSASTTVSLEKQHSRPLLKETFRREVSQRPWSFCVQTLSSKEAGRIRHAVCQNYKCNFGEKCVFRHTEVDCQSIKPKKSGGKGSVALLEISKQLGCVFQDFEPSKSKSILRKGMKFLGPKRSVYFSKGTRHAKNRESKGPSQGVIHSNPHERNPMHQHLNADLRKKP